MSIETEIIDGFGSGKKLKINGEGEISVVVHPHPPRDENVSSIPFKAFFTSPAGATDMRVNGSTTNVSFAINADPDKDLYIKCCSIVIADASATLGEFGNLNTALTNGVELRWSTQDLGDVTIADGLKTNFEFMRLALGQPSFVVANNVVGTSDAFLPVISFDALFGLQYGLRLRGGTNDKIEFIVKDDVTGVDQFDAVGFGIKI